MYSIFTTTYLLMGQIICLGSHNVCMGVFRRAPIVSRPSDKFCAYALERGNQGSPFTSMPRGRALSDDSRRILVHMSSSLSLDEIVKLSGIPKRTVERILADVKRLGTTARIKPPPRLLGAPRVLSQENVQASTRYQRSCPCL